MDYQEFLQKKIKKHVLSGFDISEDKLNKYLFPFQKYIARKALSAGKYAVFADCGLGKTLIQIEWANQVFHHTGKPVLILTPLAVSGQTIQEGQKFGIDVVRYDGSDKPIQITNYEQIENIDCGIFSGIVLDECFAPDTHIQVWKNGALHEQHIKDCKIGESVLNCLF